MKRKDCIPEFKIGLKRRGNLDKSYSITEPEIAAEACRSCFDPNIIDWREEFIVVALNQANKMLGFYNTGVGGMTGTVSDPRVIFQFALLSNASKLILCHNHPSGNTQPSTRDKDITQKLVRAGEMLDIAVLDHIIITSKSYFSFSEKGLM